MERCPGISHGRAGGVRVHDIVDGFPPGVDGVIVDRTAFKEEASGRQLRAMIDNR